MNAIEEQFNDVKVYIQIDPTIEDLNVITVAATKNNDNKKMNVVETSAISEKLYDLKTVIKSIATSLGSEMQSIANEVCPDEMELELSLSCSASAWVILKGEGQVKLKLNWKKS